MLRNFLLLAAGILAVLSPLALAAQSPTIIISGNGSISIAINPVSGPDGPLIAKTIQNDLALSGLFSITTPQQAAMTVSGVSGGGSLQGKVLERSGNVTLMKTYEGGALEKAHAFANDIIETLTGAKGIAGSKIAFIATKTGHKELYTANYDGSGVSRITSDSTICGAPSLSPDGRRVAYTSYKMGYADIYVIDLASNQRERVVKYPGTNSGAAFSPDGDRIACTMSRDGNPELYVVGADGSNPHRLTHTPGVETSPTWSPDGSEIIYSSDDTGSPQLFRMSASGGSARRISTGYGYCTKPNWSPDGRKVAFNIRQGGFQVAILDLGSNNVRVVSAGQDPVWGPDSRHLLFTQDGSLIMLDVQSGKKVNLISGMGIYEPTWTR